MPPEEQEIEQDVKAGNPSAPEAPEVEETSVAPESQSVQPQEEVDEKGVPWKNREAEIRRKITEELQPFIQQQIQDGISRGISSQPTPQAQTPVDPVQQQLSPYSDDQLEQMAESNPEWKFHIRKELTRRVEERASNKAYERLKGESVKERTEREQQESFGYIQQTFPEAFINIGGQGMWNTQSPLVQRAFAIYNSDPAFKANGKGLRAAFLQAKGEMALGDSLTINKEKVKISAQQRRQDKVEAKALNGGIQSAPVSTVSSAKVKLQKLMEQHRKTGDPKTFAEILKLKGAMPDFS